MRAANGTITTFDAPGAGTGAGQGTLANDMNDLGTISGLYVDASNIYHGFVRAINGTVSTFDAPGAGTGAGQGTEGISINRAGSIGERYFDASNVSHGFLRTP